MGSWSVRPQSRAASSREGSLPDPHHLAGSLFSGVALQSPLTRRDAVGRWRVNHACCSQHALSAVHLSIQSPGLKLCAAGHTTRLATREDSMNTQLRTAWRTLQIAFFVAPFVAGLDKFFHLLVNWDQYLSPIAQRILGGGSHTFMLAIGVVEMIVGLMVITRWTRLGAYIASLWLLLIAINLITTGHYFDIALRDIGLCLGAFALAKLTEAMQAAGIKPVREQTRMAA